MFFLSITVSATTKRVTVVNMTHTPVYFGVLTLFNITPGTGTPMVFQPKLLDYKDRYSFSINIDEGPALFESIVVEAHGPVDADHPFESDFIMVCEDSAQQFKDRSAIFAHNQIIRGASKRRCFVADRGATLTIQ